MLSRRQQLLRGYEGGLESSYTPQLMTEIWLVTDDLNAENDVICIDTYTVQNDTIKKAQIAEIPQKDDFRLWERTAWSVVIQWPPLFDSGSW